MDCRKAKFTTNMFKGTLGVMSAKNKSEDLIFSPSNMNITNYTSNHLTDGKSLHNADKILCLWPKHHLPGGKGAFPPTSLK